VAKKCGMCLKRFPPEGKKTCDVCRGKARARYYEDPKYTIDAVRIRRRVLRLEVYAALGGARCACCGEAGLPFLTIDHIDGPYNETPALKSLILNRGL